MLSEAQRGRAGRILEISGAFGLPLTVGLALGFVLADRGVRWLPTMLGVVLGLCIACLLAVIGGRFLMGDTWRPTPQGKRVRRRIIAAGALLTFVIAGRLCLFWVERPSPLTELTEADFNRAFVADAAAYRDYDQTLRGVVDVLERRREVFGGPHVLGPDDERALLDSWRSFHDTAFALDQIRLFYEDWYRFDPSRADRSRHLRSYLLTFSAELALFEQATRFVRLVRGNPDAVKFLDAPHPSLGLDAGSLSRFEQELLGTRDQARVVAGERYLQTLAVTFAARDEADALGVSWLWRRAEGHLRALEEVGAIERSALTVSADLELVRRNARKLWYPVQSGVAEWMGDTRVRRPGWYLVSEEQQTEMDPLLEPGDVMLSRKNWYVSNVGLPGFWPHAIIYLGAPDKLEAYFDDPEVRAWVKTRTGEDQSFAQYVAELSPSGWLRYQAGTSEGPYRVMEAISEGVSLNTMAHAAGDYLAALRPNLPKVAKARAIAEAFGHLDKPYDFDFDFATDHALVCTELVWRSYRASEEGPGLEIPLEELAGRRTLPANSIAKLFADEHGREDAQLDFVYFVDAIEKERRAVVSDEAAFLRSYERAKWDILQE